jgi:hypothetical protein
VPVNLVPTTVSLAFLVTWVLVGGILLRCRRRPVCNPGSEFQGGMLRAQVARISAAQDAIPASHLSTRHRAAPGRPGGVARMNR